MPALIKVGRAYWVDPDQVAAIRRYPGGEGEIQILLKNGDKLVMNKTDQQGNLDYTAQLINENRSGL